MRDETSNGVRAGLLFDPKNLADAKSGFGRAPDISAKSIFNRAIFQELNLPYVLLPISSRPCSRLFGFQISPPSTLFRSTDNQ